MTVAPDSRQSSATENPMARTAASSLSRERDAMVTRAPSAAASCAVARPMPELPPMTRTWAPASLVLYFLLSVMLRAVVLGVDGFSGGGEWEIQLSVEAIDSFEAGRMRWETFISFYTCDGENCSYR